MELGVLFVEVALTKQLQMWPVESWVTLEVVWF